MHRYETVRNYLRILSELKGIIKNGQLDAAQLENIRNGRVCRLVKHAYEKVPYYRKLFDKADVKPEEILTAKDLERVPVTTKDHIRGLPVHEITSSGVDLNRCQVKKTSGSTGVPLTLFRDDQAVLTFYCLNVRALIFAGARFTDRILAIGPTFYPEKIVLQRLGIGKVKTVSPFEDPAEIVRHINLYRPDILHCYPSVFKSIIAFLIGKNEEIYRPRILISSAESLDSQTRERIIKYLGSKPFQFYGSVEIGRIGSECFYRDGIHIYTDFVIPEFIPAGIQSGSPVYRIILTNLNNLAAPIIRYEQGDLVQMVDEPCPCGRKFLKITILDSRGSDVILLPGGNTVSALYLTSIILKLPGIAQFKIVQETIDRIVIKVITKEGYSEGGAGEACRAMDSALPGARTSFEIVPHIERDPSGKLRQFQSEI
jgi:phenylacetate-CoA ligase